MTTRNEQLVAAVNEAIVLLRNHGLDSWVELLTRLRNDYTAEPTPSNRCKIRSILGGAGTLNDVVLARDRVPLIAENNALERCRRKMAELSLEIPSYD